MAENSSLLTVCVYCCFVSGEHGGNESFWNIDVFILEYKSEIFGTLTAYIYRYMCPDI